MQKLIKIVLFIILNNSGFCQSRANQITFFDSTNNQIHANKTDLIFIPKKGADTIYLAPLYDINFTYWVDNSFFLRVTDSIRITDNDSLYKLYTCEACYTDPIKIIDSIDINSDGVKELFLFRRWKCSTSPSQTNTRKYMYLAGGQQQEYNQHEVWDIKSKNKIYEIKNLCFSSVAVTTNVISSINLYKIEVKINKDGSFSLSNFRGINPNLEIGKYHYDKLSKTYVHEFN